MIMATNTLYRAAATYVAAMEDDEDEVADWDTYPNDGSAWAYTVRITYASLKLALLKEGAEIK